MKRALKGLIFLLCLTLLGFTQIDNVQFKDLDGNSYDLYEVLNKGKHVYIMMAFNG